MELENWFLQHLLLCLVPFYLIAVNKYQRFVMLALLMPTWLLQV